MNWPEWIDTGMRFLTVLILIANIVMGWLLWGLRKEFMTRDACTKRCDQHAEERRKLETRQDALETSMRNMPTSGDMTGIRERLGGIEGDVKEVAATLKGQADLLTRLEKPLNLLMEHHLRENR